MKINDLKRYLLYLEIELLKTIKFTGFDFNGYFVRFLIAILYLFICYLEYGRGLKYMKVLEQLHIPLKLIHFYPVKGINN